MVVSDCGGRWRFANFDLVDEKVDHIEDPDLRAKIGESLFRVLEHPHDPRGVIWFEQRVGMFRGDRVAQLAPNWFLTYRYEDRSLIGDCVVFMFAFGEAPPR